VSVAQPAGAPHTSLAYALLPGATERQLTAYARRGPLTVLANSTRMQAVRHAGLGLLAVNVFADGSHDAERLTVDGPGSVILREERDGTVTVAVADPTMGRDTVSVLLRGRAMRAVSADDGVSVSRARGGTRIEVITRHGYGRSLGATLR
jgi:hyaluronate lyase